MRKTAHALLTAALCALLFPAVARAADAPNANRPKIDMVFAIDTTSSMGGLIQAAKTKVWWRR